MVDHPELPTLRVKTEKEETITDKYESSLPATGDLPLGKGHYRSGKE
jgi:hypothetical protein